MSIGTAEARYRQLEQTRQSYLDRARDCSELTIPSLIPPDVHNETSDLYTPFQGIGARGVNNLASKLSLALMPPTHHSLDSWLSLIPLKIWLKMMLLVHK